VATVSEQQQFAVRVVMDWLLQFLDHPLLAGAGAGVVLTSPQPEALAVLVAAGLVLSSQYHQ
jgi:hypothetical protein